MRRAILIVLDSVGCGGAPDAADFGDAGANTLGHIREATGVELPNLARLGLWSAVNLAAGTEFPGPAPQGLWGAATERSKGKDTPSGHWELAGVPVPWAWHYFPRTVPAFPPEITAALIARARLPGILGDCHASGTEIIARLGAEHLRTGRPICYTSADSVMQIAAHEEGFGLARLYEVCEIAAELVHPLRVGRVIARPFTGSPGAFRRTANRRDYAIPPPEPTLLDRVQAAGGRTIGIGKIGDIFAHRGLSEELKAPDDMGLVDCTRAAMDRAPDGALIFVNLVEFDSVHGHRRDPQGYARALAVFDARLPGLEAAMRPGDLMILTADHGNDPTWTGSDHTRERVPVLGLGVGPRAIGLVGFADVGESVAAHLGLAPGRHGRSFL
ncbi:MAG: phosphopentomutase [Alphaproteobacteria bacterium]|nr:MAG: phosphopentomutase [Alphaproteobacteria bacterium]